ncbi:MAG: hypothetical protein COA88_11775 [Kordia sp.]|nr:MAG: hypothetical protein COA88_11775 [Kordia sp.]
MENTQIKDQQTATIIETKNGTHDNEFSLNMSGIANFKFTVDKYSIADGGDWDGVTTETKDGKGVITVKASRNSSSEVANWFSDQLKQGSCLGCSSSSSLPKKLNFAFVGTMSFEHTNKTYTLNNVLIAQGHSTRNTWWLGGLEMSGMDTPVAGMILSPTNTPLAKVSFATIATQISEMNMGVFQV